MKIITPAILLLVLATGPAAWGQELEQLLQTAGQEIETVETKKYRYEQSLEYDPAEPWKVTLTISRSSLKKRDAETIVYTFNLGDLDERLINYEDDRDEQTVELVAAKKRPLIKETDEDGEVSYQSGISVWSTEIDKATVFRNLLREAAPLAEAAWKADFDPGVTIEEINAYVKEAVASFDTPDGTVTTVWQTGEVGQDHVIVDITDAEGTKKVYHFSLADIAKNSVDLEIRKGEVSVELGTIGRAELIAEEEDGAFEGYVDEITLPVAGVDEARRIISALELLLPLAREVQQARMPDPTDLQGALNMVADIIGEPGPLGQDFTASLEPSPVATLMVNNLDEDGNDEDERKYLFDFGDLSVKSGALRSKGKRLNLTYKTRGGKNFIETWEEGEPDGFDDELLLPVASVEAGRKLEILLPFIMEAARNLPVAAENIDWLTTAVDEGSTDEVSQVLINEDACTLLLEVREHGKKADEIDYTFNLYNLDHRRVELEAGKDGVEVQLFTNKNEKIINVLDNGEPEFTDGISIRMKDLATGKKAQVTLQQLVEGCLEQ